MNTVIEYFGITTGVAYYFDTVASKFYLNPLDEGVDIALINIFFFSTPIHVFEVYLLVFLIQ